MEPTDPGGPLWWLTRLEGQLTAKRRRVQVFDDYYRGRHRLAFASPKFLQAFGGMFSAFSDNWCGLVVDTLSRRLSVQGFRMSGSAADDRDAWRMWQFNNLDSWSQLAHREALIREESYAIVWFDPDDPKTPLITVEDPCQVAVAHDPARRSRITAALKMWTDDDDVDHAVVYLPKEIYKYRSGSSGSGIPGGGLVAQLREWELSRPGGGAGPPNVPVWMWRMYGTGSWEPEHTSSEQWPLPNPLGVVPVVPLRNRPRIVGPSGSELTPVIPRQDAINKLCADMIVASEFQSYRQRWVTGMDIPTDPVTGKDVEPFQTAVDRLWVAEDVNVKFGEFGQVDLTGYIKAIEMNVSHISATSGVPLHYTYLSNHFPSGDAIVSSEQPLIERTDEHQLILGEAWEDVIRLGFQVIGAAKKKWNDRGMETVWRPSANQPESTHVDATVKKLAAGVPARQIFEDLGYSQTQIDRFATMLRAQVQEQAALAKLTVSLAPPPDPALAAASPAKPGQAVFGEDVPGSPVREAIKPATERL